MVRNRVYKNFPHLNSNIEIHKSTAKTVNELEAIKI